LRPTVFRISGTVDLETSNFAYRLIIRGTNVKKCKIRLKREGKGSRDIPLKFWDALHIWGTVEPRNVKVGMQVDHQRY